MLHAQQGSVSRIILACFIGLAFCFALVWPQYTKHRNGAQLKQAGELGRALAFAEGSYQQQHGTYTAQFNQLDLPLLCPLVADGQGPYLDCPHYTYRLEGELLRIAHKQLPVWLEVDIAAGDVQCRYPAEDWAGQDLCARWQ